MLKSNASAKESATRAAQSPPGASFPRVSITYIRYLDPWGGGLPGGKRAWGLGLLRASALRPPPRRGANALAASSRKFVEF